MEIDYAFIYLLLYETNNKYEISKNMRMQKDHSMKILTSVINYF